MHIPGLHNVSMEEAIKKWEKIDKKGTSLAGIRLLCQHDLFYLLVKVCKRKDMLHEWIYTRCREVQEQPNGMLDLWAREHCKSSIITFGLTIQDILNNPEITIGIFSENFTLASKFLMQIKMEFEKNEVLKQVFPDILYKNPSSSSPSWNNDKIVVRRSGNPKEPTIECQGLMSMKVGAHYDLMIYDDVITASSVTSPEMVDQINNYFEMSLSQSKQGGKKRYIGTRYSFADTYQMILDREIAIPRIHPATDSGMPDGIPVLFSLEYWEEKKRENSTTNLSCQYLQNPTSGQEKVFDISKLEVYEVRPIRMNVIIVVDPAKSQKKGSANTAMLVIGISGGKKKYLLDGYCHQMTLVERWVSLKTLYKKWKNESGIGSVKVGYETYGSGLVDVEYFQERMIKENDARFIIEPLTSSLNGSSKKRDRIERIQPDLIYHNIFLPYPTEEKNIFTRELSGLTKLQIEAIHQNNRHLLSKSIKRKTHLGQIYDLCDIFVNELDSFPYGGLVDCIDGFSRIYDMEISAPKGNRNAYFLPENELI